MADVDAVEISHGNDGPLQWRVDGSCSADDPQCYVPPVRTLSRHLMARQLLFFAGASLAFLVVGTILDILVHLDEVVEQRDAAGGLLPCLWARVGARYGEVALPSASFVAAFLCIGLATRAGETTALRACGISPARNAAPMVGLAAALALATFWVNETWLLDARRTAATLESEWRTPGRGRGSFWYHTGEVLYNVVPRAEPGSPGDLTLYELDEMGRVVTTTRARARPAAPDGWRALAGERTRFTPGHPTARPRREPVPGHSLPLPSAATRGAERNTWSLAELRDAAAAAPRRTERTELHRRLAAPTTVLLFALLALPLGWLVRRGLAGPALGGAALLAGFQALDTAALLAAGRGALPPGIAAWLAPAVLGAGLGATSLAPRVRARLARA